MPLISTIAVAGLLTTPTPRPQDSVSFAIAPTPGKVMEFATSVVATSLDGANSLNMRLVTAERAQPEGPNFRFSRYVNIVNAEGTGPYAPLAQRFNSLAGKTYPLVLSARGARVEFKRGKWDNDPYALPAFMLKLPASATIGQTFDGALADMHPTSKVTLREVRSFGSGRAAIFSIAPGGAKDEAISGTAVLSVEDGLVLLMDIDGQMNPEGKVPASKVHILVRRLNVEGLDRLAADLRIGE